jgi:hypothetical protein
LVLVEPYEGLLGLIAADNFAKAERLWLEHKSKLSDAQSLKAGGDCLLRAKELVRVDPIKAHQAAAVADQIATGVHQFASDAKSREAGGQLASDVASWLAGHPQEQR